MHSEKVEKVSYYNTTSIELIDLIELLRLPFSLGNALKYIVRCNAKDSKGSFNHDLNKALYYLGREKENMQYTWEPVVYGPQIELTIKELNNLLPPYLGISIWWIFLYIKCNKVIESKASKYRYLDNAMKNIARHLDESKDA